MKCSNILTLPYRKYRNHQKMTTHLEGLLKKLRIAFKPDHQIWQTYHVQQAQKALDEAKRL